jgi:hypothetical protein
MTGIKEWNQESDKRRTSEELNPHFTGSMGVENKRGEKKQWNLHPFHPTHHGTGEGWNKRGTIPQSKPTSRAP